MGELLLGAPLMSGENDKDQINKVSLSVRPSVSKFVCLSVSLSIWLAGWLAFCLRVCSLTSVRMRSCLPGCLYACLPLCVRALVSVCLFVSNCQIQSSLNIIVCHYTAVQFGPVQSIALQFLTTVHAIWMTHSSIFKLSLDQFHCTAPVPLFMMDASASHLLFFIVSSSCRYSCY